MKWELTLTRQQLDKAVKDYLVNQGKVETFDAVQCLNVPEIRVTVTDGVAPKVEVVGPDLAHSET